MILAFGTEVGTVDSDGKCDEIQVYHCPKIRITLGPLGDLSTALHFGTGVGRFRRKM